MKETTACASFKFFVHADLNPLCKMLEHIIIVYLLLVCDISHLHIVYKMKLFFTVTMQTLASEGCAQGKYIHIGENIIWKNT